MLKCRDEDFLFCLDGCSMSLHNPCAIILTSSVIHIWNCSENFLLCSFPISDVHLTVDYNSSELFVFVATLGGHHTPYLSQVNCFSYLHLFIFYFQILWNNDNNDITFVKSF